MLKDVNKNMLDLAKNKALEVAQDIEELKIMIEHVTTERELFSFISETRHSAIIISEQLGIFRDVLAKDTRHEITEEDRARWAEQSKLASIQSARELLQKEGIQVIS